MSCFAGLFNQTAVHWVAGAVDGSANIAAWGAGAEVASGVRWERGKGLIRDRNGNAIEFDATIYTDGTETIVNEDRMYEGALTSLTVAQQADPTLSDESWSVVHTLNSPSVDAKDSLLKIFLRAPG